MGKKLRGAALRAKKRQQEAMEELQDHQAEQVAASGVVDQSNEQLFVLDTEGGIVPHNQRPPKEETLKKKRTLKILTAKEKRKVENLLKTHSRKELVRMVKEGKALLEHKHVRTHGPRADKTRKANYDLWGDSTDNTEQNTKMKSSSAPRLGSAPAGVAPPHVQRKARKARAPDAVDGTVAVEVANAGQSYRPDPTLHKQALEQAKKVEARRTQAEQYENTPISQGMSEETKALLVGDTDSEDEGSDSDMEGSSSTPASSLQQQREKMTRAQRNKQKRLRAEKTMQEQERKRRRMENSVGEIPRYKKEFRKEARELHERKEKIEQAKEASKRIKGSKVFETASAINPIEAPTYPIGLASEVKKSTLRTIKPKGSLITDRIMSLRDRDLAAAPAKGGHQIKKRRARKSVKGKRNAGTQGADFAVLG